MAIPLAYTQITPQASQIMQIPPQLTAVSSALLPGLASRERAAQTPAIEQTLRQLLADLTASPHGKWTVGQLDTARELTSQIDGVLAALAVAAANAPSKPHKVKRKRTLDAPMLRWEEELQLPPDQVDAKLWVGASGAGWRVMPRYTHAAEKSTWAYLAPSGVRLMSKAAAFAAAGDGGQAALAARQGMASMVSGKLSSSDAAQAALAQAEAEGLTLVRSVASQTGYKHVMYRPQSKVPFAVWVSRLGAAGLRGSRKLGIFGTAEEGALCYARHLGPEASAAEAAAETAKLEAKHRDQDRATTESLNEESAEPKMPGGKGVPKKCTKCGQLKKGHKCPMAPSMELSADGDDGEVRASPTLKKKKPPKKKKGADDQPVETTQAAPAKATASGERAVVALPDPPVVALPGPQFFTLPGHPVMAVPMGIW
uniref:AP2/ERF domain-containing protein n=1 Tax=Calcidiscus leptoporus TaxID=127549 RepID=A0A7S0P3X9_9EUKA|mmetsp:Transcript_58544/g.134318  ORF Transcript_58544/g.134318 Transcript_58544/m.134318 type:complete len:427 (+) Transcript_58544:122-1402(+)